jgi:hypothetical protein
MAETKMTAEQVVSYLLVDFLPHFDLSPLSRFGGTATRVALWWKHDMLAAALNTAAREGLPRLTKSALISSSCRRSSTAPPGVARSPRISPLEFWSSATLRVSAK